MSPAHRDLTTNSHAKHCVEGKDKAMNRIDEVLYIYFFVVGHLHNEKYKVMEGAKY
jgi:hypothetical protein